MRARPEPATFKNYDTNSKILVVAPRDWLWISATAEASQKSGSRDYLSWQIQVAGRSEFTLLENRHDLAFR